MPPLSFLRSGDGVELAIHAFGGPPSGPVLVWAHANGFCTQSYGPFFAALSRVASVVSLDLRGHGLSAQPPPPYPESLALNCLAADYVRVLESVRAAYPDAPLIGAGHSMGGLLPLLAAAQGQAFDRLVLIEAAVFPPSRHPMREQALALTADRMEKIPRRRAIFAGPEELRRALERMPAFASMAPEHLLQHCTGALRQRDDGRYELRCPPAAEGFLYGEVARFDKYAELARLALPVLLVGADPDHPGSTWVSRTQGFLHETIAGSRLEMQSDTGHLAPLQAPADIAQRVERWIRS